MDYHYELRTLILRYRLGYINRAEYETHAVPLRAALNAIHNKPL